MLKLAGDPALVNGSTADESWLFARAASAPASAEVKALVDLPAEVDLALSRVRRPDRVPGPRVGELLHTSRMRRLLQLLPSGGYVMSVRVPPRVHVVGLGKAATQVRDLLGDHEDVALVATEPWPPTDTEAVARSRGLLAAGQVWPVVVAVFAAPESAVGHVLDGHHSLAAYLDVDVPPVVVCLVPDHAGAAAQRGRADSGADLRRVGPRARLARHHPGARRPPLAQPEPRIAAARADAGRHRREHPMSATPVWRGWVLLAGVAVAVVLLVVSGVSTLFWAWPAYTYQFGTPVVAAYDGTDCESGAYTRRTRSPGTSCVATWQVDGQRRTGTVTDDLGVALPPPPNEVEARAFGDRARTTMTGRAEYYVGLAGLPVLLAYVVAGAVGWLTGWLRPVAGSQGRPPSGG